MRELPAGWTWVRLEDVTENLDHARVPVNREERSQRPGDVPYFGATGQVGWIDKPIFTETLVLLGEDGAPFFDATKPKAYVISGPAWVNNHAHVLRTTVRLNPEYLRHWLNVFDYRGYANGTTRLKLTQQAARAIPVALPSRPEQDRIVAAIEEEFSLVERATTTLRTTRGHLETLRSSVLRRASAANGEWTTLGEVADIVGGVTKDTKKEQDPDLVEAPYLRVANVQRGYLDLNEISTIRVPREKANALRLKPGDILFNEGGDRDKLGRGWVWQGEIDNCIHQNHVFRARLKNGAFEPKFVSIHGNTFGSVWFERMGKQTTNLASINLRTLKAFPIPVLPIQEQRSRVVEAERQTAAITELSKEIDRADTKAGQLRSAILTAAFSGGLA